MDTLQEKSLEIISGYTEEDIRDLWEEKYQTASGKIIKSGGGLMRRLQKATPPGAKKELLKVEAHWAGYTGKRARQKVLTGTSSGKCFRVFRNVHSYIYYYLVIQE